MLKRFLVCLKKIYWITSRGLKKIYKDYFGKENRPKVCSECGGLAGHAHMDINHKLVCMKCHRGKFKNTTVQL